MASAEVGRPFQIELLTNQFGFDILRLEGEFFQPVISKFREAYKGWIVDRDPAKDALLVIDMTEVTFIDSMALGSIVGLHKLCEGYEFQLALVVSSDELKNIFRITGLGRLINIFNTLEDVQI